jgi:putative ABC transport system substrate-binding protein
MKRRVARLAVPTAVAWSAKSPAAAQSSRALRLGVLTPGHPGPVYSQFIEAMAALGYAEGRNLVIEGRFAQGNAALLPTMAADLVRLEVDIIAATGAIAAQAARDATSSIPIVFSAVLSAATIVSVGLVASADRPGRNITGFTSYHPDQTSRTFALLKEVIPAARRVAILGDLNIPHAPDDPGWSPFERAYEREARNAGLEPHFFKVRGPQPDLEGAFNGMMSAEVQALVAMEVPVVLQNLPGIAEEANRHRVPSIFPGGSPNVGNLINFGTAVADANRAMATYVDRIAKGANPGDLPIGTASRVELVINQKTAQHLGVVISPELMKRADRVI